MVIRDLSRLEGDQFVIHYGGRLNQVDAFTFANSLIALAEAAKEINRQINPDMALELTIDALGGGSFRARIKTKAKHLKSLLKTGTHHLIMPILVAIIYDRFILGDDTLKITATDTTYIIEHDGDRIILPIEVLAAKDRVRDKEPVMRHIEQAFAVLERDESISDFGITQNLEDTEPIVSLDRGDFAILSRSSEMISTDDNTRVREERVDLVIVKAILQRGDRKWQFIWNGFRVSAPIRDSGFFDKMESREYTFGHGDIIDGILRYVQIRDKDSGAFENDMNSFEVLKVYDVRYPPRQIPLVE